MKFTLEIKLGNEAMQSLDDIWERLHLMAVKSWPQGPATPDYGYIFDTNGNKVGHWEVSE